MAREVLDLVRSVIERGADEIRHSRINDAELLVHALLDVEHLSDETSHLSYNGAAQLKVNLLTVAQPQTVGKRLEIVLEIRNGVCSGSA